MNIFEYDKALEECYNPETGEFNEDLFNSISCEKSEKLEGLILCYKDTVALGKAIKEEEEKLKARRETEENKAKSLKEYIKYVLKGEKFKTSKVSVSYRKTSSVELADNFVSWATATGRDDLLSYKEPEVSKTKVKEALTSGEKLPARIVENMSTIIK